MTERYIPFYCFFVSQVVYVVQQKLAEHRLRFSSYDVNSLDAAAAARALEQLRCLQVGGWRGWGGWWLGRVTGSSVGVTVTLQGWCRCAPGRWAVGAV